MMMGAPMLSKLEKWRNGPTDVCSKNDEDGFPEMNVKMLEHLQSNEVRALLQPECDIFCRRAVTRPLSEVCIPTSTLMTTQMMNLLTVEDYPKASNVDNEEKDDEPDPNLKKTNEDKKEEYVPVRGDETNVMLFLIMMGILSTKVEIIVSNDVPQNEDKTITMVTRMKTKEYVSLVMLLLILLLLLMSTKGHKNEVEEPTGGGMKKNIDIARNGIVFLILKLVFGKSPLTTPHVEENLEDDYHDVADDEHGHDQEEEHAVCGVKHPVGDDPCHDAPEDATPQNGMDNGMKKDNFWATLMIRATLV